MIKSDTAISKELQQALKQTSLPLSNVPDHEKDYHPRSGQKVVDLIHPSLFPVIYCQTRVPPDRIIGLDDSIDSMGQGSTVPVPTEEQTMTYLQTRVTSQNSSI